MVEQNQEQNLITSSAKLLGNFLHVTREAAVSVLDFYWKLVKRSTLVLITVSLAALLLMRIGYGINDGFLVSLGVFTVFAVIVSWMAVFSIIIIPLQKLNEKSEIFRNLFNKMISLMLGGYFLAGYIYFTSVWENQYLFMGLMFVVGFLILTTIFTGYTLNPETLVKRARILLFAIVIIVSMGIIIPEEMIARIMMFGDKVTGIEPQRILITANNVDSIRFFDSKDRDRDGKPKAIIYFLKDKDGSYRIYNNSGFDPNLGLPVEPVTPEIVEEIKEWVGKIDTDLEEPEEPPVDPPDTPDKEPVNITANKTQPPPISSPSNLETFEPGTKTESEKSDKPLGPEPEEIIPPPVNILEFTKDPAIEEPVYIEVRRNFKSLRVENDSLISSDNLNVADLIMGTVIEDAETEDKKFRVVENSKILLRVISIEKAGTGGPAIRLEPFNISLASDGSTIRTNSDPIRIDRRTKPYLSKKAVAGGIAGGILGGIFGGKKGAAAGAGAGYGAGLAAEILTRGNEIQIPEKFPIEFKDVTFTDRVYEETRATSRF